MSHTRKADHHDDYRRLEHALLKRQKREALERLELAMRHFSRPVEGALHSLDFRLQHQQIVCNSLR